MPKRSPRFIASELGTSYAKVVNALIDLNYLTDEDTSTIGDYSEDGRPVFDDDVLREVEEYLDKDSIRCCNCGKVLIPNGGRISTNSGYFTCPWCGTKNEVDKN